MKTLSKLNGRQRRRHRRFLRRITARGAVYVRREFEFRMAERLHRAGLATAAASKANLFGAYTGRPFRELAVFAREDEARRMYPWTVMSRHR